MNTHTVQISAMIICCALLLVGTTGCKKSEPPQAPEKTMVQAVEKAAVETAETAKTTVAEAAEQTTCPVMGGAINKELFTEYQGKKVYFCCDGCKEKFLADPEKYLSKLPQFKEE